MCADTFQHRVRDGAHSQVPDALHSLVSALDDDIHAIAPIICPARPKNASFSGWHHRPHPFPRLKNAVQLVAGVTNVVRSEIRALQFMDRRKIVSVMLKCTCN